MSAYTQLLGNIVAFEGHADTVSTQLRLLPTSPQLLILPSVQCYLPNDTSKLRFDAPVYIKKVHDALLLRHQAALDFLQGSTPESKRLVFMNGGTPSAQALCIKAIMRHETEGDYYRAEEIFAQLVKNGVAGLNSSTKDWKRRGTFYCWGNEQLIGEVEDPITRAMRAADALDRQTANLQPTNEIDLTLTARARSNSLPLYGYADSFGDAAPFFVFGLEEQEDTENVNDESIQMISNPKKFRVSFARHADSPDIASPWLASLRSQSPISPRYTEDTCNSVAPPLSALGIDGLTPRSDVFSILSTDNVVYGEASLLDMRASERRASMTRVKSLDRIYTAAPKYRDLCIPSEMTEPEQSLEAEFAVDKHRNSCMIGAWASDSLSGRLSYIGGPRTVVVNGSHPVVKVAPVPDAKKRKHRVASYVDRGTDADQEGATTARPGPVLPFQGDMVIYFKDEAPDALLDTIIKGFKSGNYPIFPQQPKAIEESRVDEANFCSPDTPESQSIHESESQQDNYATMELAGGVTNEHGSPAYEQSRWSILQPLNRVQIVWAERPPTPAEVAEKICDLNIWSNQTAVAIQNSLRSVLKVHFPQETEGYTQFKFSLLPELEGLWKPIFREAEPDSLQGDHRRVDQILAIGAQRSVDKDFASIVIGQLEKLGTHASGRSRSGRLDFRYLLANAMQAYTAQPLTSQAYDNPFANSFLLATLVIPHLETYLALNAEVRYLLLEYPPEHLPTVLALQRLVGVDLMKVAQIVDSQSRDPMPFTHIRGASISNSETESQYKKSPTSSGISSEITFSEANFILTSTASDAEINTFLCTVQDILMSVSNFYTPEGVSSKASSWRTRSPSLQSKFSAFPKISGTSQSSSPTTPRTPRYTYRAASSGLSSRAPSFTETIRTMKSSRSKHSRLTKKRSVLSPDGQSIMTVDLSDSEWDLEDRRLMPTLVQKPDIHKSDSHKALRFLGLA